ncbi:unnamed protein product [Amoebophrya sp. A25]|nr:unnamed protein product [Amoebophrya sp. A25]|eukprot:GSA25T00009518001.1
MFRRPRISVLVKRKMTRKRPMKVVRSFCLKVLSSASRQTQRRRSPPRSMPPIRTAKESRRTKIIKVLENKIPVQSVGSATNRVTNPRLVGRIHRTRQTGTGTPIPNLVVLWVKVERVMAWFTCPKLRSCGKLSTAESRAELRNRWKADFAR